MITKQAISCIWDNALRKPWVNPSVKHPLLSEGSSVVFVVSPQFICFEGAVGSSFSSELLQPSSDNCTFGGESSALSPILRPCGPSVDPIPSTGDGGYSPGPTRAVHCPPQGSFHDGHRAQSQPRRCHESSDCDFGEKESSFLLERKPTRMWRRNH